MVVAFWLKNEPMAPCYYVIMLCVVGAAVGCWLLQQQLRQESTALAEASRSIARPVFRHWPDGNTDLYPLQHAQITAGKHSSAVKPETIALTVGCRSDGGMSHDTPIDPLLIRYASESKSVLLAE